MAFEFPPHQGIHLTYLTVGSYCGKSYGKSSFKVWRCQTKWQGNVLLWALNDLGALDSTL